MAMGYDNFGTSFYSLYSPMGRVQSNYSYINPNNPSAGAGDAASNINNINNYYTGFYDPLASQMTKESLLKHVEPHNDYYARPIPAHIKTDNTGTILGAAATGLSALALIAALRKGKAPAAAVRQAATPPTAQTIVLNPPPYASKNAAAYSNRFKNWVNKGFNNPGTSGAATRGATPNPTGSASPTGNSGFSANPTGAAGSTPISGAAPVSPNTAAPQYALPQYTSKMQAALNKQAAAMNLPSSGQVYTTPYIRPALPQYTSKVQNALDKQTAAMNLPSSGQVYTTPYIRPALPQYTSKVQNALDKQTAAMNLPSSGQVYTTPYNRANLPSIDKVITGNNPSSFVKEGVIPERYLHPYIDNTPVYRKALPEPKQPVAALPQYTSKMQTALDKQAVSMNLPSSGKIYEMPAEIADMIKTNRNVFGNVKFNTDALNTMKVNNPSLYSRFVSDFNNIIRQKGAAGVVDLIKNKDYKEIFEILK